jgi:hypothetical protein
MTTLLLYMLATIVLFATILGIGALAAILIDKNRSKIVEEPIDDYPNCPDTGDSITDCIIWKQDIEEWKKRHPNGK